MTCKNFTTTFEEGLRRTCLFPRFSALDIVFKQSANADILVIWLLDSEEIKISKVRPGNTMYSSHDLLFVTFRKPSYTKKEREYGMGTADGVNSYTD